MKNNFKLKCFIEQNTNSIRNKLDDLGYIPTCPYDDAYNGLMTDGQYYFPINEEYLNDSEIINCEQNQELFFALAALKDESIVDNNGNIIYDDKNQWFTTDDCSNWFLSTEEFCGKRLVSSQRWHKATKIELIQKFN